MLMPYLLLLFLYLLTIVRSGLLGINGEEIYKLHEHMIDIGLEGTQILQVANSQDPSVQASVDFARSYFSVQNGALFGVSKRDSNLVQWGVKHVPLAGDVVVLVLPDARRPHDVTLRFLAELEILTGTPQEIIQYLGESKTLENGSFAALAFQVGEIQRINETFFLCT